MWILENISIELFRAQSINELHVVGVSLSRNCIINTLCMHGYGTHTIIYWMAIECRASVPDLQIFQRKWSYVWGMIKSGSCNMSTISCRQNMLPTGWRCSPHVQIASWAQMTPGSKHEHTTDTVQSLAMPEVHTHTLQRCRCIHVKRTDRKMWCPETCRLKLSLIPRPHPARISLPV